MQSIKRRWHYSFACIINVITDTRIGITRTGVQTVTAGEKEKKEKEEMGRVRHGENPNAIRNANTRRRKKRGE